MSANETWVPSRDPGGGTTHLDTQRSVVPETGKDGSRLRPTMTCSPSPSRSQAALPTGSASVEQVALAAARELLAGQGVKGLTIEAVAATTGIAKTTLYRRWRSKQDLALAVVLDMARTAIAAPTGGDVRSALIGYLTTATTILRETLMGKVMRGLSSDLATDPALADAFHREVIALRQGHLEQLVRRGVASRQLRPDVDVALLQDLLFGPVYYRLLYTGAPLSDELAADVVDAILPSIRRAAR